MPASHAAAVIANSVTFTAGTPETASIEGFHTPAICVALESLGANTDDTLTIEIVGAAATYEVDQRTLSDTGSYIVDVPQADTVRLTSANGTTISAEARNNPR